MNKHNKNFHKAISASYTLVGSLVLFGGIGYILKMKFHFQEYILLVLLGMSKEGK